MGRDVLKFCTVDYLDILLARNQEAIRQCDRDIESDHLRAEPYRVDVIKDWRAAYEIMDEEFRAMRERLVQRISTASRPTTSG